MPQPNRLNIDTALATGMFNTSAFGSVIKELSYSSDTTAGYRFGMNGQEKDDEMSGEGNSHTAEFWQCDNRLGRRFNPDPIFKAYESQYSIFGNNPIRYIDIDGADTGDVVVAFGGGDVFGTGGTGTAGKIIENVSGISDINGGSVQSFSSSYRNTKPNEKESLDLATQAAYDFILQHYNIDPQGNTVKNGKIVIYGYSAGGVMAMHLAARLSYIGYTVDFLITVDVAFGPKTNLIIPLVTDNVKSNINYYQSHVSPVGSKGSPNYAVDPSKTKVTNHEIETENTNHGNIDEETQSIVEWMIIFMLKLQRNNKL